MLYEFRLTAKSIFFDKQTILLFFVFFGLRLLSWLISSHPIIQGIIMFCVIMGFGILYYKNPLFAWYILIGEIFLGGAGHFLNFFGLSLRSVLTITFLILWILHNIGKSSLLRTLQINHRIYYFGIPFILFVVLAIFLGLYNGNDTLHVIQDAVPFIYFILLLPAYHMFQEEHSQEFFVRLITVFIISSAIFSLITFILFAGEFTLLHGEFYSWFRDVAMGKITDMKTGFFRIVLPEHLLIVPISIIITSLLMRDEKHHIMWRFLLFSCMMILALNLSRGYFLGLFFSLIILVYKHKIKEWLKEFCFAILLLLLTFTSIHMLSSEITSTGLELFGIRIRSIGSPTIELSSNTRMMLLNPILLKIKRKPFFGSGIGSEISYTDPDTFKIKKTTQFDWGYLEMITELGLLGTIAYLFVVIAIIIELIKKIQYISDYHDFYVGLLGAVFAFLIINITSPALFHVFGILFFILVSTYAMKPQQIFDKTVTILYRIFHRLHLPKFH